MEDTDHIADDLWNVFSLYNWNRKLYGSDFVAACKKLDISLTSKQEELLSETIFNRDKWMSLFQKESPEMNQAKAKLKKLHAHYKVKINHDLIESPEDTLCVYQWRLPRYPIAKIELTCAGFIRQNTAAFIPCDIIGILVQYTFDNILDRIKQRDVKDIFMSGKFEYKSCTFILAVDPTSEENMGLHLYFCDAPEHIHKVHIGCTVNFAEKFLNFKDTATMLRTQRMGWDISGIEQIKHLESMTINVSLYEIVAFSKDDEIVFSDNYVVERAPLLTGMPFVQFTEAATNVFTSIFKEFATNEDGTMSKKDLRRWIYVNGADDASATDTRLQALFDAYGTETNGNQDRLSLQGFLNFYKTVSKTRLDHVWNDLCRMNVKKDLTRIDETQRKYIKPIVLDASESYKN